MNWIDICSVTDIPLRGARIVKTAVGCVAVFRTSDNEVFATSNRCPHKGGPLSEGIVHGKAVTCPLHNWVFSLETGKAQGPDEGQIATFATQIIEDRVLLDASELATGVAAE
ncbi:nitrite reductase small subunit NirD [Shimia sagamensis]|uniref:Assimilatory nitrite reductase (NAD(P)H) small subunit n=1 Tax=Shimia sagamensis TaxID=1566352 RepID=A0ABY1NTZ1_9RHOB|nr:nitrite reductase small subunit NirD [Shimia sagamensis]SMP17915.1 assimilatory nitrite reductase (NAD(P)H) small subunit [Shimia sagamensis]